MAHHDREVLIVGQDKTCIGYKQAGAAHPSEPPGTTLPACRLLLSHLLSTIRPEFQTAQLQNIQLQDHTQQDTGTRAECHSETSTCPFPRSQCAMIIMCTWTVGLAHERIVLLKPNHTADKG